MDDVYSTTKLDFDEKKKIFLLKCYAPSMYTLWLVPIKITTFEYPTYDQARNAQTAILANEKTITVRAAKNQDYAGMIVSNPI